MGRITIEAQNRTQSHRTTTAIRAQIQRQRKDNLDGIYEVPYLTTGKHPRRCFLVLCGCRVLDFRADFKGDVLAAHTGKWVSRCVRYMTGVSLTVILQFIKF